MGWLGINFKLGFCVELPSICAESSAILRVDSYGIVESNAESTNLQNLESIKSAESKIQNPQNLKSKIRRISYAKV